MKIGRAIGKSVKPISHLHFDVCDKEEIIVEVVALGKLLFNATEKSSACIQISLKALEF